MKPTRRTPLALASVTLCALLACSDDGAGEDGPDLDEGGTASETGDAPFEPEVGADVSVQAFEAEHIYFLGGDDGNHRQADVTLSFPEAGLAYEQATLHLELGCPNGLCDDWDRKGWIGVVQDPGGEDEQILEIARFMTPYGVGSKHVIDVSEIRPLLAGDLTLRVFIDTWVGPGHQNGDGWLVDARFDFVGGNPTRVPVEVIPLWNLRTFEYGNPDVPVTGSVPETSVELPEGTDAVELRSIITGHGQGNLDNCAEFCPRTHGFLIDGQAFLREIWRDDCDQTPVEGQQGTWQYPRAGWCPGAEVIPWIEDISVAIPASSSFSVVYDVSAYENSCRPDSPMCTGCSLGTGCDYDGGAHTMPIYQFSAMLIAYRDVG